MEKSQDINFADFKFFITHHFLKQDDSKDNGKDKMEEGTVMSECVIIYSLPDELIALF